MNTLQARGLTSRQAWTLEHIDRCPGCGHWELLTEFELRLRAAPGYTAAAVCAHLTPKESTMPAAPELPELPDYLVDASLDPEQMPGQTALHLPAGTFLTPVGEQMTFADEMGRTA